MVHAVVGGSSHVKGATTAGVRSSEESPIQSSSNSQEYKQSLDSEDEEGWAGFLMGDNEPYTEPIGPEAPDGHEHAIWWKDPNLQIDQPQPRERASSSRNEPESAKANLLRPQKCD